MIDRAKIFKWLEDHYGWKPSKCGLLELTASTDGWEGLDVKTVIQILKSVDPPEAFEDEFLRRYDEVDPINDIVEKCADDLGYEPEEVEDCIRDYLWLNYDCSWILKKEYRVPIMVETSEEGVAPCRIVNDGKIDPNSGIAWLIGQQGHSKEEIEANTHMNSGSEFVNSVYDALCGVSGDVGVLTFLTTMTLEMLIKATKKLKEGKLGSLTISRDTTVLILDPWYGTGSPEIELEHEIKIPVEMIRQMLPDCPRAISGGRWGVDEMYEYSADAWKGAVIVNDL